MAMLELAMWEYAPMTCPPPCRSAPPGPLLLAMSPAGICWEKGGRVKYTCTHPSRHPRPSLAGRTARREPPGFDPPHIRAARPGFHTHRRPNTHTQTDLRKVRSDVDLNAACCRPFPPRPSPAPPPEEPRYLRRRKVRTEAAAQPSTMTRRRVPPSYARACDDDMIARPPCGMGVVGVVASCLD